MGGIHTTIFPDEPLRMGADAVVTGGGELVWPQVIQDALANRLQPQYNGGRVPGSALLKPRWDLIDPTRYIFPSVQTVAGCPENCSFCSVWVTEGRQPRMRLDEVEVVDVVPVAIPVRARLDACAELEREVQTSLAHTVHRSQPDLHHGLRDRPGVLIVSAVNYFDFQFIARCCCC